MTDKGFQKYKAEEARRQQEIEEGVKRLFTNWMFRICRLCTTAILSTGVAIGVWIADHSERVMNALNALFSGGK